LSQRPAPFLPNKHCFHPVFLDPTISGMPASNKSSMHFGSTAIASESFAAVGIDNAFNLVGFFLY